MDGYSSSSEEDESSQRRKKKSPKRPGRPKHERGRLLSSNSDHYNYDTNLSSDSVGGIKMKFSRGDEFDFDEDETEMLNPSFRQHLQHQHSMQPKRPRGRPKGSKNKPKDEKSMLNKTPKKKFNFHGVGDPPHPPNKSSHPTPSLGTTPSPPTPGATGPGSLFCNVLYELVVRSITCTRRS